MKYTKQQVSDSIEALHELMASVLDTREHGPRPKHAKGRDIQVHAIVRSVAKSGMSRRMDFFVLRNEEAVRITHHLARVLGWPTDPDKGMRVDGCGMDMGFHTVYSAKEAFHRQSGGVLPVDAQVRYL